MPRQSKKAASIAQPDAASYDEERIPFDDVLRKLVNTQPMHKTSKPAANKRPIKKG